MRRFSENTGRTPEVIRVFARYGALFAGPFYCTVPVRSGCFWENGLRDRAAARAYPYRLAGSQLAGGAALPQQPMSRAADGYGPLAAVAE